MPVESAAAVALVSDSHSNHCLGVILLLKIRNENKQSMDCVFPVLEYMQKADMLRLTYKIHE